MRVKVAGLCAGKEEQKKNDMNATAKMHKRFKAEKLYPLAAFTGARSAGVW